MPKCPMPKVIAQTIVRDTMNAAAEAKTGRQRAASHSSSGKSSATGTTISHGSGGREIIIPVVANTAASATPPSMSSLRGGGARMAEVRPITTGATVMMPSASDAEPMLPGDQGRCLRAVKQLVRHSRGDPRDDGRDDRCRQQPQDVTQPAEIEIRTEVMLDQPCREQGFPRIAEGESGGAPDAPVAHEIGRDSRDYGSDCHWQSCVAPKCDHDARRNTCGRPEHSYAIRFGQ